MIAVGDLTPADIHVGDTVRVYSANGPRHGGLASDGRDGTVTKVGRKLVTITTGNYAGEVYRIDTQAVNGDYSTMGWFRTLDQVAVAKRLDTAWSVLGECGLTRGHGRPVLTVDQLEAIARICDPSFMPWGTVVLVDCGDRKISVIRELRTHIKPVPSLREAKNMADRAVPERDMVSVLPIAAHVAGPLVDALTAAGATVEVR